MLWICRHSIVYREHRQASNLSGGMQLGFKGETVLRWYRRRSILQDQLVPILYTVVALEQASDMLVVHPSENYLGMCKGVDLMLRAKEDLGQILELFPRVKIIWSDMLQHSMCQGAAKPLWINKARKYVNREMAKFIGDMGRLVISHPGIAYRARATGGIRFTCSTWELIRFNIN